MIANVQIGCECHDKGPRVPYLWPWLVPHARLVVTVSIKVGSLRSGQQTPRLWLIIGAALTPEISGQGGQKAIKLIPRKRIEMLHYGYQEVFARGSVRLCPISMEVAAASYGPGSLSRAHDRPCIIGSVAAIRQQGGGSWAKSSQFARYVIIR